MTEEWFSLYLQRWFTGLEMEGVNCHVLAPLTSSTTPIRQEISQQCSTWLCVGDYVVDAAWQDMKFEKQKMWLSKCQGLYCSPDNCTRAVVLV